jgi:hypothetical protein
MEKLIRKILKEESLRQDLLDQIKQYGVDDAAKLVGGMNNLVDLVFDGDLKKYYQETGIEPYRINSDSYLIPNMYIDDSLVQKLDLPDFGFTAKNEKMLGDFYWVSGGFKYKINMRIYPMNYSDGKIKWRVVGLSGDSGFGYSFITKKNTLGKRARMQIFNQIIDTYNLDSYK